jgi:hypothetical protein
LVFPDALLCYVSRHKYILMHNKKMYLEKSKRLVFYGGGSIIY